MQDADPRPQGENENADVAAQDAKPDGAKDDVVEVVDDDEVLRGALPLFAFQAPLTTEDRGDRYAAYKLTLCCGGKIYSSVWDSRHKKARTEAGLQVGPSDSCCPDPRGPGSRDEWRCKRSLALSPIGVLIDCPSILWFNPATSLMKGFGSGKPTKRLIACAMEEHPLLAGSKLLSCKIGLMLAPVKCYSTRG